MKRKAGEAHDPAANGHSKKQATAANGVQASFSEGLLEKKTIVRFTSEYAKSAPYKHAVVPRLMNDDLLRSVRSEILDNIHFTPKETDIYKIHQSGDLANLDGLPASALDKLPSLLKLRDALYSYDFRQWLSTVTGAGALSGKKTDMAVNVYVPGCHLLCHDDVIGSRRVSYILYLTNPDVPWKAEWGGALRLYPTEDVKDESGKTFKVPESMWTRVIPPAWNQLSFFAVQPGESFHDVEEVYHRAAGVDEKDGGRIRMAISGWFHIPQEGEEGFEPGLEERMAEKSSLKQLQGNAEQFDEPRSRWQDSQVILNPDTEIQDSENSDELSESELEFLLGFVTPNYLTPDTVEELNELFTEEPTLQLSNFLSPKFADPLKGWLEESGQQEQWRNASFATSRPPHKHRYQYMYNTTPLATDPTVNPLQRVLDQLLPSLAFRKWLALVTGLTLQKCSIMARRFRRGLDHQLAQGYDSEDAQLEYCLCVTPSSGWGADETADTEQDEKANGNGKQPDPADEDNMGGYELYMAGDDANNDAEGSDDGVEIPAKLQSQTGAGDRRNAKRRKADPAVYQAAADDEDDGILVSNPASWNTLSIVLRDQGMLRFVKYVSKSAPGDRYDFVGAVEVEGGDDEDGDED
jgi:Rps23 Pro-64 3,4-dihydroxylase Tpa1-like proline 4-hydroxylase